MTDVLACLGKAADLLNPIKFFHSIFAVLYFNTCLASGSF